MKSWLERNKIYFEIGTSILLGIMALLVSYQANQIAQSQTELDLRQTILLEKQSKTNEKQTEIFEKQLNVYEKQIQIMEKDFEPKFEIKLVDIIDNRNSSVYANKLEIYNLGHSVEISDINVETYLEVHGIGLNDETIDSIVRVTNFFVAPQLDGSTDGLIHTLSGYRNREKYNKWNTSLRDRIRSKSTSMFAISILSHNIEIDYKDSFGNEKKEYFGINDKQFYRIDMENGEDKTNKIYLDDSNLDWLNIHDDDNRLYDILSNYFEEHVIP